MPTKNIFFLLLLPLLPLFLYANLSVAGAGTAAGPEAVCNFLGGGYVPHDYCIAVLSSDPCSRTADPHGLAVITADIALTNATAVRSIIVRLLENASDPSILSPLAHCRKIYDGAVSDIRKAAHATARRKYAAAEGLFDAVLHAPADCEATFAAAPAEASPIGKEDNDFSGVANLGRAINSFLK